MGFSYDDWGPIEILLIISFIVLLGASIYVLLQFYVCDHQNCKVFNVAATKGEPDTQTYEQTLLNELGHDGIWPFAFIGASIVVPLSLWFIQAPFTFRGFTIVFLLVFLVTYCLISFYGHHYVRPVALEVIDYIQDYCTNAPPTPVTTNQLNQEIEVVEPAENTMANSPITVTE